MKNIIKALAGLGTISIVYAMGYFIRLYDNFTQLIFSLGIAGLLILLAFIYIYNWITNNDKFGEEEKAKIKQELKEMNKAIDFTRDWVRELEEKIKGRGKIND